MSASDELEKLKTILAHAPGFIVLCDLDANILYVNQVAHGYRMEDTLGASYYDFLAPTEAELIRDAHQRLRETGEEQTVEYYLDTPESGRRNLVARIAAYRPDDGELRGFVNVVADVTDKRAAEARVVELEAARTREALAREITRTEMILDIMLDGYTLIGPTGNVIACNAAGAAVFDTTPGEMVGTALGDAAAEMTPRFEHTYPTVVAEGRLVFDGSLVTHQGRSVEVRVSCSTITIGDEACVMCLLHDITEEKRAARERAELVDKLQQQHRLHSLGTLAGGAAHEINNPIQSIISFAELIKRRGASGGLDQFADEILSEAHRVAKIVRNLSTFARADSESHSPARIEDIVETSLGLLRHALARDGITVRVELPEDLPPVKCRNQQIRQIVINLLSNARDALNARFDGAHPEKLMRLSAETYTDDDGVGWVRVTVEDHGEGIKAEHLPHVFDPFFTTRQHLKRSGLGLAVSHGIADEHHGNMRVESEPGAPTRVHLELRVDNGWSLARSLAEDEA